MHANLKQTINSNVSWQPLVITEPQMIKKNPPTRHNSCFSILSSTSSSSSFTSSPTLLSATTLPVTCVLRFVGFYTMFFYFPGDLRNKNEQYLPANIYLCAREERRRQERINHSRTALGAWTQNKEVKNYFILTSNYISSFVVGYTKIRRTFLFINHQHCRL